MPGKLLSIERSIGIFDLTLEKVIENVVLDVSVEQLKRIVTANDDDVGIYYDFYKLDETQVSELNNYAERKVSPDFKKYIYLLQCMGEYDWTTKSET